MSHQGLPQDYVSYVYGGTIRPGVPDIAVAVFSSDPGIVAIDRPQVLFTAGSSSATFAYRPVAVGQATLPLSPPDGYLPHPTQGSLTLTVRAAKLAIQLFSPSQIGRDLQVGAGVGAEVSIQQPTLVTVVSSDPSHLLVSSDANTAGQASITLTAGQVQQQQQIYLPSLSDNGSATVTASADGYQSASLNVTLTPSAAIFQSSSTSQTIYTNSGVQQPQVSVVPLDPVTLRPTSSYG